MATYPPTINQLPAIFNPDEFYQEQTGDVGTLAEVLAQGNDGNNLGIVSGGAIGCSSITTPFGFINALETTTITDIATTGVAIDPTGTLKIKGATTKGSLLAGDGTNTIDLPTATNGSYLKTNSATASGLEWGTGINSLVEGNNIFINNNPTTDPTISVREPLNATLQIGNQLIDGGSVDLTGDKSATLGIQTTNGVLSSINLSYSEPTTQSSNAFTLQTQDTQVVETMSVADATATRTKTETLVIGGYDENISFNPSKFATRTMSDTSAGSGITFGNGSTFLNITQEVVNSAGVSKGINYQNPTTSKVVSTNQQVNSAQNLNTFSYADVGGFTTYTQFEADGNRSRFRNFYLPSSGGLLNTNSLQTSAGGCSLRQDAGSSYCEIATTSNSFNLQNAVNASSLQIATTDTAGTITHTTNSSGQVLYTQNCGTTSLEVKSLPSASSITCSNSLSLSSALNGSVAIPSFRFINTSANTINYPAITIERATPNSGAGNIIGGVSFQAKDATGSQVEWARIQTKTENVGAGNQDGTLSIFNSVNGVVSETFNFNGGQNENNSFRPLDMNGNDIRTITGGLQIGCSTSATAGAVLTLATKNGTAGSGAGLALTGDTLLSGSSGGNSGQHLCLTIGGVVYKIALLNP